jgi:predicted nucleic acid-binding protein
MTTTGVDTVFVDTNVLVFASVQTAPLHADAQQKLADLRAAGAELWISRQVIREYLVTLTRPQTYAAPQPISVLAAQVAAFQRIIRVADEFPAVTSELLKLLAAIPCGGKQVHDANIVATMEVYDIPRLLTDNTADFTRFASVITVLPLVP